MLTKDPGDRSVVMYQTKNALWDELKNFEMSLSYVDPTIPRMNFRIESVEELAEHFVMWEYAIAMCGYLMKVSPFDQPDVSSTKANVLDVLAKGLPEPAFVQNHLNGVPMGQTEVRLSPQFAHCTSIDEAVFELLASIKPGDYFAMNAFLPFTGEGRREAMEVIRHDVAEKCGVVSCLEVGPRYLHSTGQLQKGGPNTGVFLIVSADELKDIAIEGCQAPTLGSLAEAQAVVVTTLGPRRPYLMAMCPGAMLAMKEGMRKGEILFGPCSMSFLQLSSMVRSPPMPTPRIQPVSSQFSGVTLNPESSKSMSAPATANCVKRSMCRISFLDKYFVPSKSLTSPAILHL